MCLLQYVDDIIFVGETNMRNILTIKVIFRLFELIFGLRMNFHKNSFGSIRWSDQNKKGVELWLLVKITLVLKSFGIEVQAPRRLSFLSH